MKADYKICLKCHKPLKIVQTCGGSLSSGTPYWNDGFWNYGVRLERYQSWSRRLVKVERNHVWCFYRRARATYRCDCAYENQELSNSSDPKKLTHHSRHPYRPVLVKRFRISQQMNPTQKIKPFRRRRD